MLGSKRRRRLVAVVAVLLIAGACGYVLKERNLKYHPYKDALYVALTANDFGGAYATPADRSRLRAAFSFLEEAPDDRARVLALIDWINENMGSEESWTVRAVDLMEGRQAACEVHALAVAVLDAFGTKSRWLAGVRGSIGFGYLEAHVGGRWEVFRLRAPGRESLGVSGMELYRTTERSVSIRSFYPKPGERLQSPSGDTAVALFPFANVEAHPELEAVFTSSRGVDLDYGTFNPYDYVFAYNRRADDEWIEKGTLEAEFRKRRRRFRHRRRHFLGELINAIDRVVGPSGPVTFAERAEPGPKPR